MRFLERVLASALLVTAAGCDSDPPQDPTEGDSGSAESGGSDGVATDGFFSSGEVSTILTWLGPLDAAAPIDASNAFGDDDSAAQLGQRLFFDARYSEGGSISCATCHDPAAGFGDARSNTSEGVGFTDRTSPTLLNAAYGSASGEGETPWQFWDGRKDSQWSQALAPPENAVEMGSSRTAVALLMHDEYRADYEAIMGPMPALRDGAGEPVAPLDARPGAESWDALPDDVKNDINAVYVNFGKALAAYERRLVSRDSRFDQFWADLEAGEDSDALSDQEKEGLRVFIGAGRCVGCHGGPNFTDGQFHNIAVPQIGANVPEVDPGRADGIVAVMADEFNCGGPWSDHPDKGECAVAGLNTANGEVGAFKTPSLRSVSQTAPYMHTGSFATLEQVVMHYDVGGSPPTQFEGTRDELMRPLSLSAPQRQALVAFLRTLDGAPLDPALLTNP